MKLHFTIIFCLIFSVSVFGQKKEALSTKNQKATQHFKNDCKKKNHKKFEGKITTTDNKILFDDKVFFFDKSDKMTSTILQQGLIYPQILTEYQMQKFLTETTDKSQKRFLKLQKDPKASFDVTNFNVKIFELSFLDSNEKTKRFKLISKNKNLPNSVVYFIEITNSKATKNISLEEFLKDAKLTYLQQE